METDEISREVKFLRRLLKSQDAPAFSIVLIFISLLLLYTFKKYIVNCKFLLFCTYLLKSNKIKKRNRKKHQTG